MLLKGKEHYKELIQKRVLGFALNGKPFYDFNFSILPQVSKEEFKTQLNDKNVSVW